jgi:hypothetical protein
MLYVFKNLASEVMSRFRQKPAEFTIYLLTAWFCVTYCNFHKPNFKNAGAVHIFLLNIGMDR